MANDAAAAGPLIGIGGAEDRHGRRTVLARVVELTGVVAPRAVVLSSASEDPVASGEHAGAALRGVGAEVRVLPIVSRAEAADPAAVADVLDADLVFLGGGDQVRLVRILRGTPVGEAIHAVHRRGGVVAGTSAGAASLGARMVARGACAATAVVATGLGLVERVLVDQHFTERGRLPRLAAAVARTGLLGVGVDEDTAVVLHRRTLEVVGRGSVTVVGAGTAEVLGAGDVRAL
jgi:cyanophycinase